MPSCREKHGLQFYVTFAYGFGTGFLRKTQNLKNGRNQKFGTRQLPAQFPDANTPNFKFWWCHLIEKNMGFHSRVTLAYGFAPAFSRKMQKSEKMLKFNILFKTISSKEASNFKNMVIFGIHVQFLIGICPHKWILTNLNNLNLS